MKIFHCDRCGSVVTFASHSCPTCGAALGYVTDERTLRVVTPTPDRGSFRLGPSDGDDDGDDDGGGGAMWRCMNAAWGCNWMLPAALGDTWCRSCRLTRGRPDVDRPDAIAAWMEAEAAKRRLVHQLDELALPLEIASESTPEGLVFDLVYLPGEGGITGHSRGVVTLDLAETDDRHRDDLRRRLGEPFRTVIGHLRHEIGHYYWDRLIGQTDDLARFRRLFGDERDDYRQAVDRYYAGDVDTWDRTRYVTAYGAAHPWEDWAETFAHYLHILDAIDTAVAHGLRMRDRSAMPDAGTVASLEFTDILDAWRPINAAMNAVAESLGVPAVYPFDPVGVVIDKLSFVHAQIGAHTTRDRFYAVP